MDEWLVLYVVAAISLAVLVLVFIVADILFNSNSTVRKVFKSSREPCNMNGMRFEKKQTLNVGKVGLARK